MAEIKTRSLAEKVAAARWMADNAMAGVPATEKSFYRYHAGHRRVRVQKAEEFIKIAESIGIKIELME